MPYDIIVIGGSAGGMDPLIRILTELDADLPVSVFAVIHIAASSKGDIAGLIQRNSGLDCALAQDGEPIRKGRIYLARPDHHLLLEPDRVLVARGPKENRSRPAIDPLFRSAAAAFGPRVIGIVLSGMLDDGAQGLAAIKNAGGLAIVQDPKEARFPSMPLNACLAVTPDYKPTVAEIPDLLKNLLRGPLPQAGYRAPPPSKPVLEEEAKVGANQLMSEGEMRELGQPSVYTCPDCGGGLYEIQDSGMVRYRCSIGHAFGAHSLLAGKDAKIEEALSASLRALQESERLSRGLLLTLGAREFPMTRKELDAKADAANRNAQTIHDLLGRFQNASEAGSTED